MLFRTIRRSAILLMIGVAALPCPATAQEIVSGREAAVGAVALAGALLLDRAFDGAVRDGGGGDLQPLADVMDYGGRPQYALALLGGTWAVGKLAGRGETAEAAVHVATALVAGGVVNGALKFTIGRERPNETDDPHRYRPFAELNRWQSFPSGHTTVAFTLAAAVSEEARSPWVTALAYGGASAVAWSRVYEDKHWASDVTAGALLGILAGRGTVRLFHRSRADGDPPAVAVGPGLVAVRISVR
ncbi:MAG TPA: phosphatase PAP2 family protein [Longimicrobium sp.]|nr:phosphatase PAP2 family protein [Longimicrobium sp.]